MNRMILLVGVSVFWAFYGTRAQSVEPQIPVSRFGAAEALVPLEGEIAIWNVGDFDGDGDLDLIVPHSEDGFQVWKQLDDHSFEVFSGGLISTEGRLDAVGDVDGDGDSDLLISRSDFFSDEVASEIWLNQGDGSFILSESVLPEGYSGLFADLDNDGDLDVVIVAPSGHVGNNIQNWRNDGQGKFSHISTITLNCLSSGALTFLGDLNDDTFVDLFFGCDGGFKVGLNQKNGKFSQFGQTYFSSNILAMQTGNSLAGGDVDGDGDLDVVIPNVNFPSALWLNNGDGSFREGQTNLKMGRHHAVLGDIDLDGDLDLLLQSGIGVTFNGDPVGLHIYWNEGPDQFFKGDHFSGGEPFVSPRLLDIDGDGDLDILVRLRNSLVAYHNSIEFIVPELPVEGIEITDAGLKRSLQEALGKKSNEGITEDDMLRLTKLDLSIRTRGTSASPIEDFTGLEWASNLVTLDISGTIDFDFQTGMEKHFRAIDSNDLSFLSSLKKLTNLNLSFNGLTTLKLPDQLEQLESLDISNNSLIEWDPPEGLVRLKNLQITGNRIAHLDLPDDMSQLENLGIEFNQLTELLLPETFVHLERLTLSENNLQSLVIPGGASRLEWLSLRGNAFKTLVFPDHPQKLFWLNLGDSGKGLEHYDFLTTLTGLKNLEIKDARFDPNALSAPLARLETLRLDIETATQFSLPEGYASLKELNVTGSRLQQFQLPSDLNRLQTIFLNSESITEMTFPEGLIALRQFSFYGSRLRHVNLSPDMVRLAALDLSRTQVKALEIPEKVGSRAPFEPSVFVYETPLRSFKAPDRWANSLRSNRAFIRADRMGFDSSGNLQFYVTAEFGTVIVEKSNNLKNWKEVGRLQITNPGRPQRFRDSNPLSDSSGFYRVRLRQ